MKATYEEADYLVEKLAGRLETTYGDLDKFKPILDRYGWIMTNDNWSKKEFMYMGYQGIDAVKYLAKQHNVFGVTREETYQEWKERIKNENNT